MRRPLRRRVRREWSSYAIDDGDQVLLFDPSAAPREIVELAADRQPEIVLTCPWHERAGDTLVDFGQGLEIPPEWLPDGVTPTQVTEGLRPLLERPGRACARHARWASDRAALERAHS